MSRTKSTIKNFMWALIGQGAGVIISLISRVYFVKILGGDYLGLNGLFTNVLTVLSLAELGVGTAITYSLYKPLAEKNEYKCKMLMQFYKKIYNIIGVVILVLGIMLIPALPFLTKKVETTESINLIYILFVVNTSISYFFSYKRNLIIADQNRYIATIYRYSFYILMNVAQILYLVVFKNYIGFLIIQIINTLLENIFVSIKANKMYPYLKDKDKVPLDNKTKNEIVKNTKAMMMHKIGGVVVNSTDNILMSVLVNVASVGIYSNYYLIINALNLIIGQIFNSLTASVGNLCASSSKEKQYDIFNKINFMTYWIFSFCSICLVTLFNPFIELWVGKKYLFNMYVVLILIINFYITGMRKPALTFREATGLFYKDRYKAIIESIINLVASILLTIKFGVFGIFLGTFISTVTTCLWVEPYILYKYGFEKKFSSYMNNYLKKIILTSVLAFVVYELCNLLNGNPYLVFVEKLCICCIVPNIFMFLIYNKTEEFKYFYDKFIGKILNKIIKKRITNI